LKTRELEELVNKTRKRRLPRGISRGGGTQDLEEVQGTPLGSLQERFAELSRSHRAVAAFVLSHMDEVAFLTAAKLARRCSTSEATIVRFAKKLGFPGFPEFQAQVQTLVRQKIGPAQKLKRTGPIPKQLNGLLDGVLDKAIVNLRATRKRLSGEMIEKVANLIIRPRMCASKRSSAPSRTRLLLRLQRVSRNGRRILSPSRAHLQPPQARAINLKREDRAASSEHGS
jgi:DNA-binding MurR/RpiR family transcriptional regulator